MNIIETHDNLAKKFKKKNTELYTISTDSTLNEQDPEVAKTFIEGTAATTQCVSNGVEKCMESALTSNRESMIHYYEAEKENEEFIKMMFEKNKKGELNDNDMKLQQALERGVERCFKKDSENKVAITRIVWVLGSTAISFVILQLFQILRIRVNINGTDNDDDDNGDISNDDTDATDNDNYEETDDLEC